MRYKTFAEFWPFYIGEHSKPGTRALHFIGTTSALLSIAAAIATVSPLYLLAAVFSGYLFAWVGHFFIEKNRPATFRYPLFSLMADFKMYGLICAGRMSRLYICGAGVPARDRQAGTEASCTK